MMHGQNYVQEKNTTEKSTPLPKAAKYESHQLPLTSLLFPLLTLNKRLDYSCQMDQNIPNCTMAEMMKYLGF